MTIRTVLFTIAAIAVQPVVYGGQRLDIRVRPVFSFAPAEVHLEFVIAPDANNRLLEVSAESEDFYRSSAIDLEGERAPRVVAIRYRGLPAGEYDVRGALIDGEGRERVVAAKHIAVMTRGGEH